MITYTDYILSRNPHTFLKMAEKPSYKSISTNTTLYYLDWSSHQHNDHFSISNTMKRESFSSGYFTDSSPLGMIRLPHSPTRYGSYSGALGNSGIYGGGYVWYEYVDYSILGRPAHPKSKRIRVEFLLDNQFDTPSPPCEVCGDIFAEMFKIGPFSFWNSQKWDCPKCDGCCSTHSGDPMKFHMMLDTYTQWVDSNGNARSEYHRTPLWVAAISSDPEPDTVLSGSLPYFPFPTHIDGIEYSGDDTYITMENVNQTTFQKVLPAFSGMRYVVTKNGHCLIPINTIVPVGDDIIFTTDTPHRLTSGTGINSLVGVNPKSAILADVAGSSASLQVETVLNETQFSINARKVKLFPNYWYSSYNGNCISKLDKPVQWWSPHYKSSYLYKEIQMFFNDPYFVLQEQDTPIDHISILPDQNGLPDARVCLHTATNHGLVDNDLVEIVYGEHLDKVWGPFRVDVLSNSSIALPYKKSICSKFVFHTVFRTPCRVINRKDSNRTEICFLPDTPPSANICPEWIDHDNFIAGRKMMFYHGLSDRYFDVDIIGGSDPFYTNPPNSHPAFIYLDYNQFNQNIHIQASYDDKITFWLSDSPSWQPGTYGAAEYSDMRFWHAAACIKFKEIRAHDYETFHNVPVSSVIKTGQFTYRVTSTIAHTLVPSDGVHISLTSLTSTLSGGWVSNIINSYVFEITSVGETSVSIGTNLALNNTAWHITHPLQCIEVEFDTEDEVNQIFNDADHHRIAYMIDYNKNFFNGGAFHRHATNPKIIVMTTSKEIADSILDYTPFPNQNCSEFFGDMFNEPFPAVIRKAKRLYTKFDTLMYTDDGHNADKLLFESTLTKSNCSFNENSNTLNIRMTDNHGLVTGQKVQLKGMTYFSSNFYPQEVLGRESVKHFSMVYPDMHIYYLGTLDECPSCIKTGKTGFETYESVSDNDIYIDVTGNDLYAKGLINSLENDTFAVTVINSKEFSITVNDLDFLWYDYVSPGIPDIDKINIRIDYTAEMTQVDDNDEATLTFDVNTSNGLLNGRRYYLGIGSDKPFSPGQGGAVIGPSDLLNLKYHKIDDKESILTRSRFLHNKISSQHPHRFILEWEQYSDTKIRVKVFIDGNTESETIMSVYDSGILDTTLPNEQDGYLYVDWSDPFGTDKTQKIANRTISSLGDYDIAAYYNCGLGTFSFTYGLPTWDEVSLRDSGYLDIISVVESWAILRGDTSYFTVNGQPLTPIEFDANTPQATRLSDVLSSSRFVTIDPKTLLQQFVSFMSIGADQTRVKTIVVTEIETWFEVKCYFGTSADRDFDPYQHFSPGDWVELGRSRQKELNRKWQIQTVGQNYVTFFTKFSNLVNEDCRMNSVIMKKIAVRETGSYLPETYSWSMDGIEVDNSIFSILETNFDFNFSILDAQLNASARTTDVASDGQLNLKRNMKNKFSIFYEVRSNTSDPNIMHWNVIGDPRRIHVSLGYGRNELTHHQILTMGWIRDLITGSWEQIFQAYETPNFGNPGQTFAFTSSDWEITESGHLLCQRSRDETALSKTTVFKDNQYLIQPSARITGIQLYPAPIPERIIDDITFP